ncbi:MAG: T9SS type A sorting domain-containing protein [bacterium]|nr:T9SS type A sorting domain-containing protein [bacterium]
MKDKIVKYLFGLLLSISFSFNILGQSYPNFTLTGKSSHNFGPPDTILINPCIDAITEATLSLTMDDFSAPVVSAQLISDTIKLTIVDTSSWLGWSIANWSFKIKISGTLPNPYKIKYLNKTYLVYCGLTDIPETNNLPTINVLQNVLTIHFSKTSQYIITDIIGQVVYHGSENRIDLNELLISKGVYILTTTSDNIFLRQKFLIE